MSRTHYKELYLAERREKDTLQHRYDMLIRILKETDIVIEHKAHDCFGDIKQIAITNNGKKTYITYREEL